MEIDAAIRRALRWLTEEKPDGVSARLLSHRSGGWHLLSDRIEAEAAGGTLRAWLSPSRRVLFVRLAEDDDGSAELRVELPADLRREIAA